MSLHKQLVMDTACGVEEGRGAGLGTPSALLTCRPLLARPGSLAGRSPHGVRGGSPRAATLPRFHTGQPPHAPATCRVVTLMRLKALIRAMVMINAARAC